MEYKGKKFDAVVATPACGKSYLCDKYPDKFVDVDEVRLRCKYVVPEDITRAELERTKGERTFQKRDQTNYWQKLYDKLDEYVKQGRVLISAPHPEAVDYLVKNNIKFAFVYYSKDMKEEFEKRMRQRGNPEKTIKEFVDLFDEFYEKNIKENQSVLHYEFGADEYLEDVLKKFGCKF